MEPLVANGVNGQLTLLDDRIRISKKGFMGFMTQGLKGDKDILLSSLSSVQFKAANSITNGYIQFGFLGGQEAKGGLLQAVHDENTVVFRKGQQSAFERIRDEIQRRQSTSRPGAEPSVADELAKFADLKEHGIITEAEFAAKKKQLLGP